MNSLGRHVLVDLYDCDADLLDDLAFIEKSMVRAAVDAGATVVAASFHPFHPCGVSGIVAIQESHLAVHTWPEHGFAAVDLFTCGTEIDPWSAYEFLKTAFGAAHGTAMEIHRGIPDRLPGRSKTDI
jgi:spermidine synthase